MFDKAYESEDKIKDLQGKVFFARVNIGAESEPELFFEDPEPAIVTPDPESLYFG